MKDKIIEKIHIHNIVENLKRKRYRAKMNIMVALASLCKQEAADLGLILKSLVRFFKRNKFSQADLDEIERFVQWVVSRGDTIIGVPSAWEEYCALHKIRRKKSE